MSKNIHQIYVDNPITSNASTDLMYFGQSPYGATNDAAMLYSNFFKQFSSLSPYIVGPTQKYTTIQAAINAAHATTPTSTSPIVVYITSGTYTENLTLYPFVYLSSASPYDSVTIVGSATFDSGAGSTIFESFGITYKIINNVAFSITGSTTTTIVNLNCQFIGGTAFKLANTSATAYNYNCKFIGASTYPLIINNNGTIYNYNCSLSGVDTKSQITNNGVNYFYGGSVNDSFSLVNSGNLIINNASCVIPNSFALAYSSNPGTQVNIYNSIVNSSNGTGNWVQAVTVGGDVYYTGVIVNGSAQKVDSNLTGHPGVLLFGQTSVDGGTTISAPLLVANNLSDVASTSAARSNLGVDYIKTTTTLTLSGAVPDTTFTATFYVAANSGIVQLILPDLAVVATSTNALTIDIPAPFRGATNCQGVIPIETDASTFTVGNFQYYAPGNRIVIFSDLIYSANFVSGQTVGINACVISYAL